jgi:hypothetical protein
VVAPVITIGFDAAGIILKEDDLAGIFLVSQGEKCLKSGIALVDPIMFGIGLDALPLLFALDSLDASEGSNNAQLFFPSQIIADVVIVNMATPALGGIFDKKGNGNGVSATGPEDLAAFHARCVAGRPLITA